jgi:hypothetical protein
MIAAITAFFLMYWASWWSLGALCLVGVLFEHSGARGWAIFAGLMSLLVAYFLFSIPLLSLLIITGLYLVTGTVWSFWRYKRFVTDRVANLKLRYAPSVVPERELKACHPNEMIKTISAWIIIWPFSMIENVCGDLISLLEALITNAFKNVYSKIYTSTIDKLLPKDIVGGNGGSAG